MTERSLQITYRNGRPLAAYLYLAHPTGESSAKTEASPAGLVGSITPLTAIRSESRSLLPKR